MAAKNINPPTLTFRGGCLGCTKIKCKYKSNQCYKDSLPAVSTRVFGCNVGVKSTADYVRR